MAGRPCRDAASREAAAALPLRVVHPRPCREPLSKTFGGIAVTNVEPMGGYAVHLAFSDGHNRGIFPWSYLRALAAEAPPAALQAA